MLTQCESQSILYAVLSLRGHMLWGQLALVSAIIRRKRISLRRALGQIIDEPSCHPPLSAKTNRKLLGWEYLFFAIRESQPVHANICMTPGVRYTPVALGNEAHRQESPICPTHLSLPDHFEVKHRQFLREDDKNGRRRPTLLTIKIAIRIQKSVYQRQWRGG